MWISQDWCQINLNEATGEKSQIDHTFISEQAAFKHTTCPDYFRPGVGQHDHYRGCLQWADQLRTEIK